MRESSRRWAPERLPRTVVALRSPKAIHPIAGLASNSSLLFSWSCWIKPLGAFTLYGFAEGVFSGFMEGNSFHRDVFHIAVIQTVAFAQEVNPHLRIGNHGD